MEPNVTYDFCYLRYFSFIRFSSFSAKKKWKPISAYENYNLRQHLLGSRKANFINIKADVWNTPHIRARCQCYNCCFLNHLESVREGQRGGGEFLRITKLDFWAVHYGVYLTVKSARSVNQLHFLFSLQCMLVADRA